MFPCHDQLMIITCSISPKTVLREHYARLLDPLRTEVRGVQVSAWRQGACQRVRQRARARAALHHHAAWPQLQLQAHHRDVLAVQNLGPEKYFNVDKKYFNWFMHSSATKNHYVRSYNTINLTSSGWHMALW